MARSYVKTLGEHKGLEAWRLIKVQLGKTDGQRTNAEYSQLLHLPQMKASDFKSFRTLLAKWEPERDNIEDMDLEYKMGRPQRRPIIYKAPPDEVKRLHG